jgi:hypothetical protein
LSTTLLTGVTGSSLHMQWPLTLQSHGSFLKENYCCSRYGSKSKYFTTLVLSPCSCNVSWMYLFLFFSLSPPTLQIARECIHFWSTLYMYLPRGKLPYWLLDQKSAALNKDLIWDSVSYQISCQICKICSYPKAVSKLRHKTTYVRPIAFKFGIDNAGKSDM